VKIHPLREISEKIVFSHLVRVEKIASPHEPRICIKHFSLLLRKSSAL